MDQQPQEQKGFAYAFKQQVMKAWQPVPTLNSTIVLFGFLSAFFLIMGIVLISYSNSVSIQEFQYDAYCLGYPICTLTIALDQSYTGPVYFYYQLTNFYQNHRRYVKSKSPTQLSGTYLDYSSLDECDPVITNAEMGFTNTTLSADGTTFLVDSNPAVPCGLIAKSLFNDTYVLQDLNGTNITINTNNIAWPSDTNGRYANTGQMDQQWLDMTDQHFMVWMRTAALPTFRKLWGVIGQDLHPGRYTIFINNNYNVSQFSGKKSIVLSTTNSFGGKNEFLSIAYIVVGVVCTVVTLGFIIRKYLSRADQKKSK